MAGESTGEHAAPVDPDSRELSIGTPATTVLTTDLEQFAQSLDVTHEELRECSGRLARTDRLITDRQLWQLDAPYSAVRAEHAQEEARWAVAEALASCEVLTTGLRSVIETYELTEERVRRAQLSLAGLVGYGLGWLLPGLVLLAAPILVPGLVVSAAGLMLVPEDRRQKAMERVAALAESKAGALTDPAAVELVRTVVSSSDDLIAGVTRVPHWVAAMLGDDGLGVTGIASATAMVGGAATTAGMLRETPVTVRPVATDRGVPPASGVEDRIARIPDGDEQIRIDRYSAPGHPDRVEVYIAGTAALGAVTGREPLDMTSNLTAMAGGSAGSERAVMQALRQAGVTAETAVVFTGYSQGGLIAARLAASGEWNTAGLVTVGAPAGQVAVSHDVPYLAIEHTDDLVPALGGRFEHSEPLVVRRRFAGDTVDTSERLLPAHELDTYARTASLLDAEPDTRVRDLLARLNVDGYAVTSTTYRADRVLATD